MPTITQKLTSGTSYSRANVNHGSDTKSLSESIEKLYKRPANRTVVKHKFTPEVKAAILQALQTHSWTTAREAYGWAWNHLGTRVSYITVFRFLTAKGLFAGDTPRARRLAPRLVAAPNLVA